MHDRKVYPVPSPTLTRICFAGVDKLSPLGILFQAAILDSAAVLSGHKAHPSSARWRAVVAKTGLQWWDPAVETSPHGDDNPLDIIVDLFGTEPPVSERIWRIVDDAGEPILNPFCFLETCCRTDRIVSVFLVEKTTGKPDWTVLAQAHIANYYRYIALLDRVATTAAHLLSFALRKSQHTDERAWKLPENIRTRTAARVALEHVRTAVTRTAIALRESSTNEYWAIGLLSATAESLLRSQILHADRWIQSKSARTYYADPLPLPEPPEGILCERYDYRSGRGALVKLNIGDTGVVREEPIHLDIGEGHLSYPFTFREGGRTYMLPEMGEFRQLILFELNSHTAPRVVCVVQRGSRVADATLFRHADFYWIAYCDQDLGVHDNLCLLYSAHLEGPWKPHRLNPVKIDIRSSRPGGLPFSVAGNLFRPAQDCSVRYGGALVLNKVLVCDPTFYREQPIAVFRPDPHGPFPDGVHTISVNGNRVVFDGKRVFLDPRRFLRRAAAHIASRFR